MKITTCLIFLFAFNISTINAQYKICRLKEGRNYLVFQINNSEAPNCQINIIDFKKDTAFVKSFELTVDSIQFLYTYKYSDLDTFVNYDSVIQNYLKNTEIKEYKLVFENPNTIYDITNNFRILLRVKHFQYLSDSSTVGVVNTYYNNMVYWLNLKEINPSNDLSGSNMIYQKEFGFISNIYWDDNTNQYEYSYQLVNLNGQYIDLDELLYWINKDAKK